MRGLKASILRKYPPAWPAILWIFILGVFLSSGFAEKAPVSPWTEGVVRKLEMEGGFFGIFTTDGKQLLPMHLPEEFKVHDLTVRFRYRSLKDVVSIQMWGRSVVVTEIEQIQAGSAEDPKPVTP